MATHTERFEARWQLAHRVRALEREQRSNSQPLSRRGSGEFDAAAAKPVQRAASARALGAALDAAAAAADAQPAAPPASPEAEASVEPMIRQQEVEDSSDDEALAPGQALPAGQAAPAAATAAAVAAAASAGTSDLENQTPSSPGQGREDQELLADNATSRGGEDSREGLSSRVVWDSSNHKAGMGAKPSPAAGGSGTIAQLKEQGNQLVRQGIFEGASMAYAQAIAACLKPDSQDSDMLAALYSNRAHALLQLHRYSEAMSAAQQAHHLLPSWPKPLHRMAEAHLALGDYMAAAGACKAGERLCRPDSEGHTDLTPLLDRVAVVAAGVGSLVGYDGMQLEVRSAGEEAWLGGPASRVPELDGPEDEDSLLPAAMLPALPAGPTSRGGGPTISRGGGGGGGLALVAQRGGQAAVSGDALAAWDYGQTAGALQRRRTSFRSIKEAVAAARDGDRILLRRGVHNGMGECIVLSKRLLIEGEGALGETIIDQRANCPTFRITRGGVVLRNLDLDQTGFREALLVTGGATVRPLLEGCVLKCSGDDVLNIGGAAHPLLRRCTLSGKKCGVRAFGTARGRLEQCVVEKCGEQGLKAMEGAAPELTRCTIRECGEEGAVAMDSAQLTLQQCTISGCKGPGVDCSGTARLALCGGSVEGNVGGVWLWEGSSAEVTRASISGGPSHAILADGNSQPLVRECTIRGSAHATEGAWEGILHPSNTMADPDQPTDFPAEEGPFRFIPNRFTRKQ